MAGSSRNLSDLVRAWSMISQPVAPSVTTETGKIPRSLRSTWTARSSSRRVTRAAKSAEGGVEYGDGCGEVAVLALQVVDLVEELARCAHRPEYAVLLAPHVSVEVGDEAGQPRHRR